MDTQASYLEFFCIQIMKSVNNIFEFVSLSNFQKINVTQLPPNQQSNILTDTI